jgi:hypothetical protein
VVHLVQTPCIWCCHCCCLFFESPVWPLSVWPWSNGGVLPAHHHDCSCCMHGVWGMRLQVLSMLFGVSMPAAMAHSDLRHEKDCSRKWLAC